MRLLRRPLRPHLRPLLLSDLSAAGRDELLSPLSSASSSTGEPTPSSRPSSGARSPRLLPPLFDGTEQSYHVSLITPFQSEIPMTNQAPEDVNDDQEENEKEEEEDKPSRRQRRKKIRIQVKPREYSQFGKFQSPIPEIRPRQPSTLNRTPKFKGPPGLPMRRTRSFHDVKIRYDQVTDDEAYLPVNEFTFNDFILHSTISKSHPFEETTLERAILSRYTYKQICEMIAERVCMERGEGGKIHIQTIVPNIEPFQHRVPMHQIVAEMAIVLKNHMTQILGTQLRMGIRALPSWRQKEGAHTEILLYEKLDGQQTQTDTKSVSNESDNSFNIKRDTGAEIAILDTLIKNGTHLDLRAFALEHLPDISLMFTTLIAIDLSYNCLRMIPKDVFQCSKIEHLYLRHNPISLISSEIQNLKTLVFLDISFCDLHGTLSDSLFALIHLRHLDISYNCLTHIPSRISNLKNLRQFVCDGNEITYLPSTIVSMPNLRLITAKNTWLLPQLANAESSTKPQKLTELMTVRLTKFNWTCLVSKLPDSAKSMLFNTQPCDSCSGLRVGNGFRTMLTCSNLFGIKLLPLLVISCTPECIQKLLINETPSPSHSIIANDQLLAKLKMIRQK